MSGCGHQFLWEKTFAVSLQTTKFAKVFSLESFPLYGSSVTDLYVTILGESAPYVVCVFIDCSSSFLDW